MKQHTKKTKLLAGVLLTLWLGFIWGNSCLSADQSGTASGWVSQVLAQLLGSWAPQGEHILRKLAHFTEFAILGGLLHWNTRIRGKCQVSLPLLLGVLAAMADETMQLFSPGRASMVTDVWIDTCGVAVGIGAALLFRRLRAGKQP